VTLGILSINRISTISLTIIAILSGIGIAFVPLEVILIGVCVLILTALVIHTPITHLLILLVLAPLRTLIATESGLSLPFDIGQILLIVYIGGWVIFRIYHNKSILKISLTKTLIAIFVITLIFGINMWSSVSISAWLTEWLKWVIITIFVWHLTLSEQLNWQWLVYAILTSAVANAAVGLYIFFGGSGADHLLIGGGFFRAFGTFGQPNPFGGFMGITLPISIMGIYSQIVIIWKHYRQNHKLQATSLMLLSLFTVVSCILFAALIASWSRGAWLGFIISISVMVFAIPRKLSISISMSIALLLVVLGLWAGGFIPQSIIDRLTTAATDFITIDDIRGVDITTVNYAVVERIAHWQAAINITESNPFTGVGLGNYEIIYDDYRLLNWKEPLGHAHNYYLNILAETGIIGFLIYIIFWIIIFVVTWQSRYHPDSFSRSIAIGLLGAWTYIAIHSIFDNLYVNNLFLHIGLLLSILAILHHQVSQTITLE
jgi:putative inorganic carbon (hco3(-)) transporter